MDLVNINTMFVFDKIASFINSEIFSAAIGSACGAFGGAWAIWKIDQKTKLEKTLAQINSGVVLIANAITTLVNMKRIILPMYDEIVELKGLLNNKETENRKISLKFDHSLKHIIEPQISLALSFEFLYDYTTLNPNALMVCQKASDSIIAIKDIIHKRNQIVESISLDPLDNPEKALKYLGIPFKKGQIDDSLYDFTEGLKYQVDVSIFFLNKASIEFRNLGLRIIPKKWKKKIVKIEVIDPEDKKLIPTDDFIKGY